MRFEPVAVTPRSALLQQYISYYYFLETDADFETRYYAFPHTHTVLNIHQKANFEIRDYYTRVYADPKVKYNACVQGIREFPLLANLQGKLDKVTILFKPLGINQFGVKDFGDTHRQPSMVFTAWDTNPLYLAFLKAFYATRDVEARRDLLEAFLLEMYAPLSVNKVLMQVIDLLENFDENASVESICQLLDFNPRTFNRLFKKQLGVSPVTYRKVARFRHSLQNKLVESGIKRLTDLAYQSNYYDQAYFNKIYRSLTGSNPQRFFKKVSKLADERLVLEFMK